MQLDDLALAAGLGGTASSKAAEAEARALLVGEAERFLLAGGHLSLAEWRLLSTEGRAAFTVASERLRRAPASAGASGAEGRPAAPRRGPPGAFDVQAALDAAVADEAEALGRGRK